VSLDSATDQPIPRIATESVILEAVSQYGGLDGYTQSLAMERPLLTAVNGVDRLDTGIELGRSGRIIDPAALGAFPRDNLSSTSHRNGLDHAQVMALLNSQFSGASTHDVESFGALVKGTIDSQQLVITFLNKDLSAIGRDSGSGTVVVVTMPDGGPLPEWLHWNDRGQLTGTPPEGEAAIAILVQTRTSDGLTVSRTLIVNLRDGTASPLTIRKQVMDEMPPLFSRQLQLALDPGGTGAPSEMSLADLIRQVS
jgi:Putative Ig domain